MTVAKSGISQAAVVRLSSAEEEKAGQEYHLQGKSWLLSIFPFGGFLCSFIYLIKEGTDGNFLVVLL